MTENEDEDATAYHFYDTFRDFASPYNVGELYYDSLFLPKAKSEYPSSMSAHLFLSANPPHQMIPEISTDDEVGNYLGIIYKRNRETGEWVEILRVPSSGQNVPILLPVSVIGQDHPFFWKWVIHWPYNEWKCHFSLGIPPLKASADAYIFSDDGGKIIRGSS